MMKEVVVKIELQAHTIQPKREAPPMASDHRKKQRVIHAYRILPLTIALLPSLRANIFVLLKLI